MEMVLPFTLVESDALGMAAFLAEFWEAHQEQSIGAGFYVESARILRTPGRVQLAGRIWLAPFDQGVVQEVTLDMDIGTDGVYYAITAILHRETGNFETWRRVCRTFLDDLRKQFLIWRTLPPADRAFYVGELSRWSHNTPREPEASGSPERI